MKAFLQTVTNQSVFQLAPKITTVGRDGCDFIIQTPGVDSQQAVIEYLQDKNCFILKDLNSSHGTFVSSCRVQNAAVCLSDGDVIRFGCNMVSYKFKLYSSQIDYQLMQLRRAWGSSNEASESYSSYRNEQSLPPVSQIKTTSLPNNVNLTRPRPFSTGTGYEPSLGSMPDIKNTNLNSAGSFGGAQGSLGEAQSVDTESESLALLVKELTQQVKDKEILVHRLRSEVQDLQMHIRQNQTRTVCPKSPLDGRKLANIIPSRSDVQQAEDTEIRKMDSKSSLATQVNMQLQEINSLRYELERASRDKAVTAGLLTRMQRDMSNKDSTISRMARQIESLNGKLKDQEAQILFIQSKLPSPQEQSLDVEAKDKELIGLRQRVKENENKIQEKSAYINDLKSELEKLKGKNMYEKQARMKLETDISNTKLKNENFESTEKQTRVDMEEMRKRLERLESLHVVSEKQTKSKKH